MDYALKRTVDGPFDSVTEAVEASLEAHGFVVVGMHDVHRTVASKGFSITPVRIYEVRDAGVAEAVRSGSRPSPSSMLVPGRITVFIEHGDVVIAAVRPGVVTDLYPDSDLADAAAELERRLVEVVGGVRAT